jgi:hypothetical protein
VINKWILSVVLLTSSSCCASPSDYSVFLLELTNDTYNYLLAADMGSGLPENWYNYSEWGSYCSPEEAGFYMLSHIGAAEIGLISNNTTEQRIEKTLGTLKGLPKDQGFYYRYYYTESLAPTDTTNVPSIGNAMLAASLMTVGKWADENDFKGVSENCSDILDAMDFSSFYNRSSNLFYHDLALQKEWDYYSSDGRLVPFVAYALGDINEADFRNSLVNLTQPNLYYNVSTDNTTSISSNPGDVLVKKTSWDGAMFTYIVPALFIREHQTPYQDETINPAVLAQMVYANRSDFRINGRVVWGISDAYNTDENYCCEYCGAPPTAAALPPYNNTYQVCPGLITPHASALALISNYSDNAADNLLMLSQQPKLYDDVYGFKDSFNVHTGIVTNRIVTLDQEWIFLSLTDNLNGTIWRYFYQNPGVVAAHNIMYPTSA